MHLQTYLDDCWKQKNIFVEHINKFLFLINGEAENDVNTFLSEKHTLDEYKHYITKYHEIFLAIPIEISQKALGIFKVDFTEFLSMIWQQANKFKNAIVAQMYSTCLTIGKT